MTAPPTPLHGLTWQEFLDLPEEMRHAELIDGEIIVTTPSDLHQRVVVQLTTELRSPQLPSFSVRLRDLVER